MTHRHATSFAPIRVLLALLVLIPLVVTGSPSTAKADPTPRVKGQAKAHQRPPAPSATKVPQAGQTPRTLSLEGAAIELLNSYRSTYYAPALATNLPYVGYATQHANYCNLNGDTAPGCTTPFSAAEWEDPSKPGFTTTGSDYAPYMLMVQTSDPSNAVHVILQDPAYRDGWLLDLGASEVGIGAAGNWSMVLIDWGATPSGFPKAWPIGSNVSTVFRSFNVTPSALSQWTTNCAASAEYGYPISAQFDYNQYGVPTASSGSLLMDGVPQSACMVTNQAALLRGQAVMVPLSPLVNGSIYTGSISATVPTATGTANVSRAVSFTTWAPASGAPGDQSGDGVGDFTAIQGSSLIFRKMRANGTVGASLLISTRFNTSTWIGRAPDVNGDNRDDLMSRNTNGDIYVWYGNGMGSYTQGPKVGVAWNMMNMIVPIGDMNGDGRPEMVARDKKGQMWRYTMFPDRISNRVYLGNGWSPQQWMVGVGKFDGDGLYDMVSVDAKGNLMLWAANGKGFSAKGKLASGWGGYTYLFSPGDINKDGRPDLIARDKSGVLWTWFSSPSGFKTKVKADAGWAGYRAFA